jgi:ribosomal protein S3
MLAPNVAEMARRIGLFYLQKNNQDYEKTEKELTDLRISKIEIDVKGVVFITLARVGLFIGRKGENIEKLNRFLKSDVRIVEDMDSIYEALIPHNMEDYP